MRMLLWILFWFLYFPLMRVLCILLFWNSKVSERIRFEKKNKFEWLAHSFREKNLTADLCFEFSSEGEFQQVAPLIDDALLSGKKVELVFFSPSVEKGVLKLAAEYPQQIRYLRYPFLRIFPFLERRSFTHWVTAKTLIMVRYDLMPEFLLFGWKHDLKIVWMTFKKERSLKKSPSAWKKLFLNAAKEIVFAGDPDLVGAKKLGLSGGVFDFRIEQIRRRMLKATEKFQKVFPIHEQMKSHLSKNKRVILGNAWPSDLFLLRDLPQDVVLVIVPHNLSQEILELFREGLQNLGREVFEISDQTKVYREAPVVLVNKKGILCELYADFDHAYVGGGFEGSIHSVLEPLIAGSSRIACGPFHHRSSEYDIAESLGRISEVNTPEQFLSWLSLSPETQTHDKISALVKDYESMRKRVISC